MNIGITEIVTGPFLIVETSSVLLCLQFYEVWSLNNDVASCKVRENKYSFNDDSTDINQ
jgi:hypothetical protein